MLIPERLAATCRQTPGASAWLAALPKTVRELQARWSLAIGSPFDHGEISCAWVAPVIRADGSNAVIKVSMPHFEAAHEIAGLRFWNGDPTVRMLEADDRLDAFLMERCEPGTHLRARPEAEHDVVIASLLKRLWRRPDNPQPFRTLSAMIARWSDETRAASAQWADASLVQDGLRLFDELAQPRRDDVLLATDLHAGNVLYDERHGWVVIDPKPFVGDPAYDATQHLLNCRDRVMSHPRDTITRFADLLGVDAERVRLWMFARAAAEPRDDWAHNSLVPLARAVAP